MCFSYKVSVLLLYCLLLQCENILKFEDGGVVQRTGIACCYCYHGWFYSFIFLRRPHSNKKQCGFFCKRTTHKEREHSFSMGLESFFLKAVKMLR
jgi:hypothetical protein